MNTSRSFPTETEGSECVPTSETLMSQRLELLQIENAEHKRREHALRTLNMSLIQGFGNLAKNKIDKGLLEQLKRLFLEASNQTSPQTLSELRQFYEDLIYKKDQHHRSLIRQIESKHLQQMSVLRQRMEAHNKEILTRERQSMNNEVQIFLQRQKLRSHNPKGKENSEPKSSHRRKSTSSSTKSKLYSSPLQALQSSRQISRLDAQTNPSRSSIKVDCGRVATDIYCNNCYRIFTPSDFANHVTTCKQHNSKLLNKKQRDPRLLQILQRKKQHVEAEISRLVSLKDKSRLKNRLQTDLDEIVYIINNKSELSHQQIQFILHNSKGYGRGSKEVIIKKIN